MQQQQEEEYGKLCLQLQLCNEENDRLNKMLGKKTLVYKTKYFLISISSENLTKDHNQTIQKYETLLGEFHQ